MIIDSYISTKVLKWFITTVTCNAATCNILVEVVLGLTSSSVTLVSFLIGWRALFPIHLQVLCKNKSYWVSIPWFYCMVLMLTCSEYMRTF